MKKPPQNKHTLFSHQATIGNIEEYEYTKNGLRVLYVPMPGTNTVVSNIVYMVGSRHEDRGKTGIAHMLEHMLFKETKDKNGKRSPVPRYVPLQNKGALLNASTWTDRTNYYFVMPPEYLGEMLSAEAERMRGIILTPKEFNPEKQNVLSEYEMYSSKPDFILESAIVNHLFVSHGYGHDTIGFKSDIERLTCEDLRDFYDKYYWPNNAYLVIVGDVERGEAFARIDEHFSHIPRSPKPIPVLTTVEPKATFRQELVIDRKNPVTLTTLAYHSPRASDVAWTVGEVALTYLSNGKTSPLYKKLIETHKASSVKASAMLSYDPSLMMIQATVARTTKASEVQDIIFKELSVLRTKKIKEKDLVRVKNKLIADILYGRDGAHEVAHELTEYVASGNWKKYATIVEEIAKVTPEDIQAFARTWLSDSTVLIGTLKGTK